MSDKPTTSLKDKLFSTIEHEKLQPRSRLFFQCKECSMWLLWLASVLVGALAVAVSLFVVAHRQYALYEATHENFLTFMVQVLPYLWFVMFGLMVVAAWYNFRQTKRGYRYSLVSIIVSSMLVSLALGAALQLLGFGYLADTTLGQQLDMYMSQEKIERQLWQQPEGGRLLGTYAGQVGAATSTVWLIDTAGTKWQIIATDLFPRDQALLRSEQPVRVLGASTGTSSKQFHACGVFPWMMDASITREDLDRERRDFVKKVYDQKYRAEDRLRLLEGDTFGNPSSGQRMDMGVCAELAAVRRIEASMQ